MPFHTSLIYVISSLIHHIQPPIALETDLKDFRNYLKNEKNATPGFVTPFQNVTSNGNEDNKVIFNL